MIMAPSSHSDTRLRFGLFEVELAAEKLFKRGRVVHLENKPFQVLVALLEKAGEIVTREELRARLWPDGTYVDFDEGLNTAIRKLRSALGDSAEAPIFIETVTRRGYRFLAPTSLVEAQVQDNMSPGTPVLPSEAAAGTTADASNLRASGERTRSWLSALTVGLPALSLLALVAGWGILRFRSHLKAIPTSQAMEIRKLSETEGSQCVAISPDGRYLAYARKLGEKTSLRMRQIESAGDVEILAPEDVDFVGLTFSPDGNYLYFVRADKDDPGYKYLYVMPALGGPVKKLITDIDSPVSFSPSGREFVFTRGIPTKNWVEVRTAKADGSAERLLATITDCAAGYQPGANWSPDGRTITAVVWHFGKENRASLYAVPASGGNLQEIYSNRGGIGRPLWFPDGNAMLLVLADPGSHRWQLWTMSYPQGTLERITNDVGDYDSSMDLSRDGTRAATIEGTVTSRLWSVETKENMRAQQIPIGDSPAFDALDLSGGRLVVAGAGTLWLMNADGSHRSVFAEGFTGRLSRCGGFVMAVSTRDGIRHIERFESDGTHLTTLMSGNVLSPTCSPDGKFIYYVDYDPPQKILRMAIDGGTSKDIAKVPGDGLIGSIDVSHDGKSLLVPWEQFTPTPTVEFGVISIDTGNSIQSVKAPGGLYDLGEIRWSPDDSGVQYLLTRDGATNLWEQPLRGGKPKKLTNFDSEQIFNFTWSNDHKRLLLARGRVNSDIVLFTHLRAR
jgi:eukaryotic-like serine/threonine-protein kinase